MNDTNDKNVAMEEKQTETKIACFGCGKDFFVDISGIPVGERYELQCPRCGMVLLRKKV